MSNADLKLLLPRLFKTIGAFGKTGFFSFGFGTKPLITFVKFNQGLVIIPAAGEMVGFSALARNTKIAFNDAGLTVWVG